MSASLVALSTATLCHFLLIQLLVNIWDLGFTGVCIATTVHFFIRFLAAFGYISLVPALSNT